ncbi:MAG: hypothetical protein A2126_02600 [Candidatus Woykebacteria bacterium GWB1_45_5]|uniref:Uncharacterized protein n=2 Tax=Candidatus Woykeibacteriota TaxID=1817899 RepID=A0A1G1W0U6_9BACT|nr:MAG: hypothetical protein A2113_00610 [Candidatus Woykebacteria bacterium GWA1_44_8]OGY24716.1 MAG: hypothetical protein A2126_02600 [Candidatus Woykebacteria bacterium GWB1_45_5]
MKSKKEMTKIAKKLFQASFTKDNLDQTKVRENIHSARKIYKTLAIGILKSYLGLLKRHLASETLLIETADKLKPRYIDAVKIYFEKKVGKDLQATFKQNPATLGGLKITLADNQWDFSVKGKIIQLKEALLNG